MEEIDYTYTLRFKVDDLQDAPNWKRILNTIRHFTNADGVTYAGSFHLDEEQGADVRRRIIRDKIYSALNSHSEFYGLLDELMVIVDGALEVERRTALRDAMSRVEDMSARYDEIMVAASRVVAEGASFNPMVGLTHEALRKLRAAVLGDQADPDPAPGQIVYSYVITTPRVFSAARLQDLSLKLRGSLAADETLTLSVVDDGTTALERLQAWAHERFLAVVTCTTESPMTLGVYGDMETPLVSGAGDTEDAAAQDAIHKLKRLGIEVS